MNRAEIKRARFAVVDIDNRDAGVAQGSVDGKNTRMVPQSLPQPTAR